MLNLSLIDRERFVRFREDLLERIFNATVDDLRFHASILSHFTRQLSSGGSQNRSLELIASELCFELSSQLESTLSNFSFDEVRSIGRDLLQCSSQALMVRFISLRFLDLLFLSAGKQCSASRTFLAWRCSSRWTEDQRKKTKRENVFDDFSRRRRRSLRRIECFSLVWPRSSIVISVSIRALNSPVISSDSPWRKSFPRTTNRLFYFE